MQAAHRVAKNTGILYARMAITVFISLYTTRLVLATLGVADFGLFNVVGGVIAMLGFLNAAMSAASQRFMSLAEGSEDFDRQGKVFNVSVVLHFIISILVGIILFIVGYYFFDGILNIPPGRVFAAKIVYYFMIVSTIFTILTVPYDAILNAHENMFYYTITGIIESILKLMVAFYVVYSISDKLIIYGILMALISFLIMVIKRVYCHRRYNECTFEPIKLYDKALMTEMIKFAGWNFMTAAVSMVTNYGMGIVLNIFFGTLINAAQGVATQIAGQVSAFSTNMMKALAPAIVKAEGSGNRDKMLKAMSLGSKASFILCLVFMAPVIVDTDYIFSRWLKEIPQYTVVFSQLLLIQMLIESFISSLSQSIAAEGNIGKSTIVRSIHASIYLPIICLVFYLGFDPAYMYVVMLIKTIFSLVILLYYNNLNCGLNIKNYIKDVLSPSFLTFIATLSLLFILKYFLGQTIFSLIAICFSSFVISILSFYFIMLNFDEKEIARNTSKIIYLKIFKSK
jgi:Na+-driven multidrug efflux pump